MILHKHCVKTNTRHLRLYLFGDLHIGDPSFRADLWAKFKQIVLKDSNALLLGTGDYRSDFRHKDREHIKHLEDSARQSVDYWAEREMQELAEELSPFKHRIIGLLEGNHHTLISGQTSSQYLSQLLKVKYLGYVGIVRLSWELFNTIRCLDIFCCHGSGGGRYTHSDVAAIERTIIPYWDCDIYVRGHSHKLVAAPVGVLKRVAKAGKDEIKIVDKNRWLINNGGFLDGYKQGITSYVEEKNLPPSALGYIHIDLHIEGDSNLTISPTLNAF